MSETTDDMEALAYFAEYHDMQEETFKPLKEHLVEIFRRISDDSLLDIAVAAGEGSNQVTCHFPCYDVALKIKSHGWAPTAKQRSAITNVLAHYLADCY
jgi:hypothetical protein